MISFIIVNPGSFRKGAQKTGTSSVFFCQMSLRWQPVSSNGRCDASSNGYESPLRLNGAVGQCMQAALRASFEEAFYSPCHHHPNFSSKNQLRASWPFNHVQLAIFT